MKRILIKIWIDFGAIIITVGVSILLVILHVVKFLRRSHFSRMQNLPRKGDRFSENHEPNEQISTEEILR